MDMKNKTDLNSVLADNLARLMQSHEHLRTLSKVSEFTGLSTATIDRIKKATVSTSLENLTALANAFNVSVTSLITKDMEVVDAFCTTDDIFIVVNAMKGIDGNGQTKMRMAALEACELHKLHLARLRQSGSPPQLSDDEQKLVDAYRNSDQEAKELLLISAQEAVTMTIIEERSVKKHR